MAIAITLGITSALVVGHLINEHQSVNSNVLIQKTIKEKEQAYAQTINFLSNKKNCNDTFGENIFDNLGKGKSTDNAQTDVSTRKALSKSSKFKFETWSIVPDEEAVDSNIDLSLRDLAVNPKVTVKYRRGKILLTSMVKPESISQENWDKINQLTSSTSKDSKNSLYIISTQYQIGTKTKSGGCNVVRAETVDDVNSVVKNSCLKNGGVFDSGVCKLKSAIIDNYGIEDTANTETNFSLADSVCDVEQQLLKNQMYQMKISVKTVPAVIPEQTIYLGLGFPGQVVGTERYFNGIVPVFASYKNFGDAICAAANGVYERGVDFMGTWPVYCKIPARNVVNQVSKEVAGNKNIAMTMFCKKPKWGGCQYSDSSGQTQFKMNGEEWWDESEEYNNSTLPVAITEIFNRDIRIKIHQSSITQDDPLYELDKKLISYLQQEKEASNKKKIEKQVILNQDSKSTFADLGCGNSAKYFVNKRCNSGQMDIKYIDASSKQKVNGSCQYVVSARYKAPTVDDLKNKKLTSIADLLDTSSENLNQLTNTNEAYDSIALLKEFKTQLDEAVARARNCSQSGEISLECDRSAAALKSYLKNMEQALTIQRVLLQKIYEKIADLSVGMFTAYQDSLLSTVPVSNQNNLSPDAKLKIINNNFAKISEIKTALDNVIGGTWPTAVNQTTDPLKANDNTLIMINTLVKRVADFDTSATAELQKQK